MLQHLYWIIHTDKQLWLRFCIVFIYADWNNALLQIIIIWIGKINDRIASKFTSRRVFEWQTKLGGIFIIDKKETNEQTTLQKFVALIECRRFGGTFENRSESIIFQLFNVQRPQSLWKWRLKCWNSYEMREFDFRNENIWNASTW